MSLFQKETKKSIFSLVNESENELLVIKSYTGSGKSYNIRQKTLKDTELCNCNNFINS